MRKIQPMTIADQFKAALESRHRAGPTPRFWNPPAALGIVVDKFRSRGKTYEQIYQYALTLEPTLDRATWDALMEEADGVES